MTVVVGESERACRSQARYLHATRTLTHDVPLSTSPSSTWTTSVPVEDHERNNVVEGGWKKKLRMIVVDTSVSGSSDASRYPGSSDESPGDWHSYTSEDARGIKKSPTDRKVPRFRTGCLAFNGQDASLLPTPREKYINVGLTR